uniref:Uncharacterized protein n=1 Tax=uncultured SAR11 cluster alpha proteobacterium H17925_45G17 TaxID=715038 RepID=E7CA37_9PROT|nr:hypothetical protein [uncultured SAR11 cluster alpha proteobacterium H17925_45G17]
MLEHVNLNIGDEQLAKTFYLGCLGAGEDPRPLAMMQQRAIANAKALVWANLGLQQVACHALCRHTHWTVTVTVVSSSKLLRAVTHATVSPIP